MSDIFRVYGKRPLMKWIKYISNASLGPNDVVTETLKASSDIRVNLLLILLTPEAYLGPI